MEFISNNVEVESDSAGGGWVTLSAFSCWEQSTAKKDGDSVEIGRF